MLGISLSAENITGQKIAQQKLEESEGKFRALVEQSLVGIFILLEQRHLIVNAIRVDGIVRSLEINLSLIRYNGSNALLGSALDITERLDEEIRISEAVDRAQELERTSIGMELHDDVAQQISATILTLQFFRDSLTEGKGEDNLLKKSIAYLQQTLSDVRQLSHRIAPAIADQIGIFDKVRDLVDRMNVKGQLKVTLEMPDGHDQFNSAIQLVLYRVIQEQFSNVIKYAKASTIHIKIYKEAPYLILKIMDDGVGSNLEEKKNGIGLHNIRRRAQVLGGTVQIQSSIGSGFTLTVSIPL